MPEQGQDFDLTAYLRRIGLDGPIPISAEGLARLVQAHRMAIPFENLDIVLGRGISLAPQAIFDKLVHARRGGYCFEQNALFDRALKALGFDGRPLMGRVWFRAEQGIVPPRTHQLELVMLNEQPWIADVGFGGSLTPPLPLVEGEYGPDSDGLRFRLRHDDGHGWMFERQGATHFMEITDDEAAIWQEQYSFTTDSVFEADREMGNHWTSTRPNTRFTSIAMAHRIMENGYASLSGNRLKVRNGGDILLAEMKSAADIRNALHRYFDMPVSDEEAAHIFAF
ncbi:MAG: acetyltransferase [Sphingobium sp.]|nr:acetyltransferase [Sphingobium sp.]